MRQLSDEKLIEYYLKVQELKEIDKKFLEQELSNRGLLGKIQGQKVLYKRSFLWNTANNTRATIDKRRD
ncbi:hypothetical protein [Bacillus cereus]|uniref:hypothetical protein n=1 Tax=Bacillus cereus TaxID=1396 RepID=UPI00240D8930|nr:hypothetical protein [Bacillus cereus]MDG1570423.1 hypothetical protein [Bacillus cereus]